MDNKMSVLRCTQNALDDFPSARLSLARLCPHRALFRLTVRVPLEHTEGDKSMIFRAYASKNPGVWGGPQGALVAQRRNNGNRKFTIFAIRLLTKIKTVADTFVFAPALGQASYLHSDISPDSRSQVGIIIVNCCLLRHQMQRSVLNMSGNQRRMSRLTPFSPQPMNST